MTDRVPSDRARVRLLTLQAGGVGYRQVARVLHVKPGTIQQLRSGRQLTLPAGLETAILTTRFPLAHRQLVDATEVCRILRGLQREGFTVRELEDKLRLSKVRLNPQAKVTVKTVLRVRNFYTGLMLEGPEG